MNRTREQWAAVCPKAVAKTASPAAVMYLVGDALADIARLHEQADQLRAELDDERRRAEVSAADANDAEREARELAEKLAAVTAERDRLKTSEASLAKDLAKSLKQQCADIREIDQLRAEVEALRKDAEKFRHVERAMEALGCDEREGGIVTAASLVLISSAHKLNAARGVIEQEGVTFDDDSIGDWRVTIERIDAAMAAKEGE